MTILPGGGGDTVIIGGANKSIRIFDSSSPVTMDEHDRLILPDVLPGKLRRLRAGDHLVLCDDAQRFEVMIENHFCRGPGSLSTVDTPNNEIEAIVFPKAREIWLTDILYAQYRKSPKQFALGKDFEGFTAGQNSRQWRIRPFSSALPNWLRPARSCRQP